MLGHGRPDGVGGRRGLDRVRAAAPQPEPPHRHDRRWRVLCSPPVERGDRRGLAALGAGVALGPAGQIMRGLVMIPLFGIVYFGAAYAMRIPVLELVRGRRR